MKTKRICAGEYEVQDGGESVRVFYHELCKGWMAAANWTRDLYTDPVETKRMAVENAESMLIERNQSNA